MTNTEKLINNIRSLVRDENIFEQWVQSRGISKYLGRYPHWRKVTRAGLRCSLEERFNDKEFPLRDHVTLWRDNQGKKVLISQPYTYYPGDMKSCFAPPNIHYVVGESEKCSLKKIDGLKAWCEQRNLDVKIFPSTESWYLPCSTILIEIREKEGRWI